MIQCTEGPSPTRDSPCDQRHRHFATSTTTTTVPSETGRRVAETWQEVFAKVGLGERNEQLRCNDNKHVTEMGAAFVDLSEKWEICEFEWDIRNLPRTPSFLNLTPRAQVKAILHAECVWQRPKPVNRWRWWVAMKWNGDHLFLPRNQEVVVYKTAPSNSARPFIFLPASRNFVFFLRAQRINGRSVIIVFPVIRTTLMVPRMVS